jgi:hypothetical protein
MTRISWVSFCLVLECCLLQAALLPLTVHSFSRSVPKQSQTPHSRAIISSTAGHRRVPLWRLAAASESNDDNENSSSDNNGAGTTSATSAAESPPRRRFSFLEETARQGAERIAQLSIHERTRRAMLAEAVEDRMVSLEDELEQIVTDLSMTSPRDAMKEIVQEIQVLREQYQTLVTGKPSAMLDMMGDGASHSNADN